MVETLCKEYLKITKNKIDFWTNKNLWLSFFGKVLFLMVIKRKKCPLNK